MSPETTVTRYPLAWPLGWRRTPRAQRRRAAFSTASKVAAVPAALAGGDRPVTSTRSRPLTVADGIARLAGELARLGASQEVLSTNVEVRLDGLPRSGRPEPSDPGAAVYFRLNGQPRCLACDRWDRVADNIAAIAQHIDALRRIDRYGVGSLDQAFAGYAALPPAAVEWWLVFGLPRTATLEDVELAFKRLALEQHPDVVGGSHDAMARLTAARTVARLELAERAR